jgi:hypothetical protein
MGSVVAVEAALSVLAGFAVLAPPEAGTGLMGEIR